MDALGLPGGREATARALKDKALTRAPARQARPDPRPLPDGGERRRHRSVPPRSASGSSSSRSTAWPACTSTPWTPGGRRGRAWERCARADITGIIAEEYLDGPVVKWTPSSCRAATCPSATSEYRMNERYVEWEVSTPAGTPGPGSPNCARADAEAAGRGGPDRGSLAQRVRARPRRAPGSWVARPADRQRRPRAGPARLRPGPEPDVPHGSLGIDELPATSPAAAGRRRGAGFTPEPGTVTAVEVAEDAADEVRTLPKARCSTSSCPTWTRFRDTEVAAVIGKGVGRPCRRCSPSPTACPGTPSPPAGRRHAVARRGRQRGPLRDALSTPSAVPVPLFPAGRPARPPAPRPSGPPRARPGTPGRDVPRGPAAPPLGGNRL
ncbi:hypothetical protein LT493_20610 [Streptomyces tricolor]|nr:hypothetical protein [Streptomyces tricolor]